VTKHEVLQWHVKRVSTSNIQVAPRPGIYIIGHSDEILGLSFNTEFFYVGKSENLKRRITQHDLRLEDNPRVIRYLKMRSSHAYIWYSYIQDKRKLDETEKFLIRTLKPKGNRLEYKTEKVPK
jgi:excinuclease UvrABC nuclease subunit